MGATSATDAIIQLDSYAVRMTLGILLKDKTTKHNIIWATDSFSSFGAKYYLGMEITPETLTGFDPIMIQPRIKKAFSEQQKRTRTHAEVFTPSWLCNKMNNYCDEEWFGRKDVFNIEKEKSWETVTEKIPFPENKDWKKYVDGRRFEITCGEAPYIASRYDAATGDIIEVKKRIGILDRKLRVVSENAETEEEWIKWAIRAFQSVYGYEYQGDSLVICRINMLMTFVDYLWDRWNREPSETELKKVANIIAWNFWQMDGLNGTVVVPKKKSTRQLSFFDDDDDNEEENKITLCKIYDWRRDNSLEFNLCGRGNTMKFDYVIGNPPYQDTSVGDQKNYAAPIYHLFMEESYKVADKVELIHPARFLFNAGSTPKDWNNKILNDEHFKVLDYEQDSSKIFSNTDIKGGVVISYHNNTADYGKIETFTPYNELNTILKKVESSNNFTSFSSIVVSRTAYRMTPKMHEDHPEALNQLSSGHAYDMSTNIFDRLPQIFSKEIPNDNFEYIKILGRENNERVFKYVRRDYINNVSNLDMYKVLLPNANGNGALGEILSMPLVCEPAIGSTETFISIGAFSTVEEANRTLKYIKTKFARVMLGILKTTQHITPDKWKYVPLQDFTNNSDINWSLSIPEIDKQLYKKYGLSDDEIKFIEEKVKEME